jgi:pimeloyl-ACP methyl ester carboxylesterase
LTATVASAGTIAFSHANGFGAGTYQKLFQVWRRAGFVVLAVDRFGHDPAYPVSSNWPRLRDQLIDTVRSQAPGQAVHLVGHSLGGYVSLLAACRQPALAASLTLVDSPVVAGWRAHSLQVMKAGGLFHRFSPGRISSRRRWQWPTNQAALAHFQNKTAFAAWDADVLRDYIDSGTEADPQAAAEGGVRLRFSREVETHIYNTLPHTMGAVLKRHPPRCPISYIGGTRSTEGRQAGMSFTRLLVRDRVQWIEGSHLFPMEQPQQTAEAVLTAIRQAAL